ncbi:hypothetical protein ACLMJK_006773 [Lecanora helva]
MAMSAQKRKAEDDLDKEQRLTKRFDLLNLDQNGKLYVPKKADSRPPRSQDTQNSMQVDDTKDRVYIHNLDDELSDIDSEEEKLVFLPDIEKKFGKIPKSVLLSESHPSVGSEMIVYSVPTSLSIPKEQDNVRKAIIESRARAREKQLSDATKLKVNGDVGAASANHPGAFEGDEDAMDIG